MSSPEEENFRLYFMEHCMHTDCEEGNGGEVLMPATAKERRGLQPVVRTSSNRHFGDSFTKVRNMDRIRVIVEA